MAPAEALASHELARTAALAWRGHPGERHMLLGLLNWMTATGRLRNQTTVALEVALRGRRVDVATVTARGVTCAYELKLETSMRLFEQALYNQQSFDRSYVVIPAAPTSTSLKLAADHGIGIIQINGIAKLWAPAISAARSPRAAADAIFRQAAR